jgi:hypothetical protein
MQCPRKKMERSFERLVGYDRFVGGHAYRQLTELYRAMRRSRQLLPTVDETALETAGREESALRL